MVREFYSMKTRTAIIFAAGLFATIALTGFSLSKLAERNQVCAPEYMCNAPDPTLNARWCCPIG